MDLNALLGADPYDKQKERARRRCAAGLDFPYALVYNGDGAAARYFKTRKGDPK